MTRRRFARRRSGTVLPEALVSVVLIAGTLVILTAAVSDIARRAGAGRSARLQAAVPDRAVAALEAPDASALPADANYLLDSVRVIVSTLPSPSPRLPRRRIVVTDAHVAAVRRDDGSAAGLTAAGRPDTLDVDLAPVLTGIRPGRNAGWNLGDQRQ